MTKEIHSRLLFLSVLLILSHLFFSCENVLNNNGDSHSNGASSESQTASLCISLNGFSDSARNTINPQTLTYPDLTNITISGIFGSEQRTLAQADDWDSLETAIEIEAGTWKSFTFTATIGSATYTDTQTGTDGSGYTVQPNDTLELAFSLAPDTTEIYYGGIEFTLTLPDTSVKSAVITLTPIQTDAAVEAQTISVSEAQITYARSKDDESKRLETGSYRLSIKLYASEYDGTNAPTLFLNEYKAAVNIAAGLTSTGRDTLTSLNEMYTITFEKNGGEFDDTAVVPESYTRRSEEIALPTDITKDNAVFMGWYEDSDFTGSKIESLAAGSTGNKTFYAKWLSTAVYVSATGNDTNDGLSEDRAVATLKKAATLVNTYATMYELTGENWTIFVSGTVKGNQSVSDTISVASLMISGVSGANTDILDGEQKGTTLSISTATPITITNLKITNGKSSSSGAGISIVSGNLTLGHGVLISGNECTENGGGVWNSKSTLLVQVGTEISGNTATRNGGGIYNCYDSTLTMSGGKVSGNTAENGGGIYNNMITGQIGKVFIYGSTIIGDETATEAATASSYSNSATNGGGIYNVGTLYLGYSDESTEAGFTGGIYYNYASNTDGGGIYSSGSLTMNSGTVSKNYARHGAGIYCTDTAVITNGTISENTADQNAGGMFINGGILTLAGGSITNNTATNANGGGIFIKKQSSATLTMTGGTISENKAPNGDGGGVYAQNAPTITMSGGTISKNTAGTNGGGVYVTGTMFMYGSAVIGDASADSAATATNYSNSALSGGGVYNAGTLYLGYSDASTKAELTGGIYHNYVATKSDNTLGYGGGIMNAKTLYAASGTVAYNATAKNGGGVYNATNAVLSLAGITVSSNAATASGGGMFLNATTTALTLEGCTVTNNSASNYGGGIDSSCALTLDSVTVSENSSRSGSGVCVRGNALTLQNSVLSKNEASVNGGGVFLANNTSNNTSLIASQNTVLSGNTASNRGGGIFLDENSSLTIDDAQVKQNHSGENGGGIFASSSTVMTMERGSITLNSANGNAGGVYTCETFYLKGGTLTENTTTGSGGAIRVYTNGNLIMTGGTISRNTATSGGGIIVADGGSAIISGGTISENTASNKGDGVYTTGTFTMSESALIASDNDVYLTSGKTITVGSSLTADTPIATITPASYTTGTQILNGTSALLASEYGKFTLAQPSSGTDIWEIASDGTLQKQVSGGITISVPTYSNKDINLQQTAETDDSLTFTVDSDYSSYLWTVGGTAQSSTTNTLTISKSIVSTAGVWIMAVASDDTNYYEAKIFVEAQ